MGFAKNYDWFSEYPVDIRAGVFDKDPGRDDSGRHGQPWRRSWIVPSANRRSAVRNVTPVIQNSRLLINGRV